MKTINKFIKDIPNRELAECIKEILVWHKTGVLKGERVRNLSHSIKKEFNIQSHCSLRLTEDAILTEASKRFITLIWDKA